jgi:hypothetical protein
MASPVKTSNFKTFTPLVGGFPGTAPNVFSASTEDDNATLLKDSYMNDFYEEGIVKVNDLVFVSSEKDGMGMYAVINKETDKTKPPKASLNPSP